MSLLSAGTELKRFRHGTLPKLAIAVLLFIPLIYGALYLWAFWAPTDNLNKLPVAIVNLDEPAQRDDGTTLSAGADIVDEVVASADLAWNEMGAAEAATSVADGDVYFSVTIPADFSRTLAGLQDDPQSGKIAVTYNDTNSFLASTLGKQAMVQLRDAVAATATRTAADELLIGIDTLSEGTRTAADAAAQLADGSTSLADGSAELTEGLGALANGTSLLVAKVPALTTGTGQLADGLSQLADGATTLADGTSTAASGSEQLATGITQLSDGSTLVAQGAGAVAQLYAVNPNMTLAELDAVLQSRGASIGALAQGAKDLSGGLATASGSARQLSSGLAQLSGGASTLHAKTVEASAGAQELAAGASTIAGGAQQLDAGVHRATEGSTALAEGATTLATGAGEFARQLEDGAGQAPSFTTEQMRNMGEAIAAPVALDEQIENEVQGFGGGFAPFFMALASFVGALITWLILRALPRRPLATGTSGLRSVLTGFWPAALIAVGQVVIMMLVLVYGIGLRPDNWVGTSLFLLLTTLAFLALQQMFIVVLGSATGRVVSLVLLMLQLSSSGGTYPVETTPRFFQWLHPFMPASYVVDGLRQMIGGGVDARFWIALAVMAGTLAGSLAISALSARRQKVWTIERLHPELAI